MIDCEYKELPVLQSNGIN